MMINQKALKLRHEYKYRIHAAQDTQLTMRLSRLFSHDTNAGAQGTYRISSLYFDTPYDSALKEKVEGVNVREKFRLRYYNEDTGFIRLEKKMKINGLCAKQSAPVNRRQVQLLLEGQVDFLKESGHPLLLELYAKIRGSGLQPKTIVTYDREAFCFGPGNVRVTLDRHVRSGLLSVDFLNTGLPHTQVVDGERILEIKYDHYLPEIVRMAVQIPGIRVTSCSKYAECRRYD